MVKCVACGLCLPHCPTFRLTGRETASPRGRIAAMRAVEEGVATVDASFTTMMDECLACRACEAACPSGVPFGRMIEGARAQAEPTRDGAGARDPEGRPGGGAAAAVGGEGRRLGAGPGAHAAPRPPGAGRAAGEHAARERLGAAEADPRRAGERAGGEGAVGLRDGRGVPAGAAGDDAGGRRRGLPGGAHAGRRGAAARWRCTTASRRRRRRWRASGSRRWRTPSWWW